MSCRSLTKKRGRLSRRLCCVTEALAVLHRPRYPPRFGMYCFRSTSREAPIAGCWKWREMTRKLQQSIVAAALILLASLVFVVPTNATSGWETIAHSQVSGKNSKVGSALASKPLGLRFEVETGISSATIFWTDTCSKGSSPTLLKYSAYRVSKNSVNNHVIPVASKADWCSVVYIIIGSGGTDRIYLQKKLSTTTTTTTKTIASSSGRRLV